MSKNNPLENLPLSEISDLIYTIIEFFEPDPSPSHIVKNYGYDVASRELNNKLKAIDGSYHIGTFLEHLCDLNNIEYPWEESVTELTWYREKYLPFFNNILIDIRDKNIDILLNE